MEERVIPNQAESDSFETRRPTHADAHDGNAGPLVSVCIPLYNSELYIGQTIKSVLAQSLQDFELIIADDGSSDRSMDIVREFKDPRIRCFQGSTNLGMQGNWNRALREAQGKYIKVLCHDDILHPECLEKQAAAFGHEESDTIVLVSSGRDIIDGCGKRIITRRFPVKTGKIRGIDAIRACVHAGTNVIGEPTAVMFKKDIVSAVGGFDSRNPYVIDLDFWSRLLLYGDLYFIGESLCSFRVFRGSASFRTANMHCRDIVNWMKQLAVDPCLDIKKPDLFCGIIMTYLTCQLRRIFFLLFSNQGSSGR
jgi:glycosyltransferase involved in cell wall biosynthesis